MLFKIVDTETGALLPRGKEGEIVCAGPNVMLGYLNNPKANAETFDKDGWMRTGDIGKVARGRDIEDRIQCMFFCVCVCVYEMSLQEKKKKNRCFLKCI
jgi:acyl-CoA synthetase (AMP-forming)/AMP-acid ligase II